MSYATEEIFAMEWVSNNRISSPLPLQASLYPLKPTQLVGPLAYRCAQKWTCYGDETEYFCDQKGQCFVNF